MTSGRYDEMTATLVKPLVAGIRRAEWVVFDNSAHFAPVESRTSTAMSLRLTLAEWKRRIPDHGRTRNAARRPLTGSEERRGCNRRAESGFSVRGAVALACPTACALPEYRPDSQSGAPKLQYSPDESRLRLHVCLETAV